VLGRARVWGRAPAPGATGRAVGGPAGGLVGGLLDRDAGAEATLEAGTVDGVSVTWTDEAGELAPQPVSSAAAMTTAASGVRCPAAKVATPASCRSSGSRTGEAGGQRRGKGYKDRG
jgi:hypothetical protein